MNLLLQDAKSYRRQGLWPIPIPRREKAPRARDWPNLRIEEEHIPQWFRPNDNVGILLGTVSAVIDVDLDCPEAVRSADMFLRATGWRFGRKSKPQSHRVYSCAEDSIPTKRFGDPVTNETLVELRGDGGQTVFPPSTHPSGEPIAWEPQHDGPATVGYDDTLGRVQRLAAWCLVIRYGNGSAAIDDEATWLASLEGVEGAPAIAAKTAAGWLGIAPKKPLRPKIEPTFTDRDCSARERNYATAALTSECEAVASTGKGNRNNALNDAALKLGHKVARGWLDEGEVEEALEDAADQCGHTADKRLAATRATIRSGLRKGMSEPAADLPESDRHPQSVGAKAAPKIVHIAPAVESPPQELSEDRLAIRFVERYGRDFRYVAKWGKWMLWLASYWEEEPTLLAFHLARKICREAAAECLKESEAKSIAKARTVSAVEMLARSDRAVAAITAQWDADLLGFNSKDED